ncbi:TPA: TetR/AcrR family transcriptional regulator C-terminal domain-containing protein [Pseudomonas aeruginosa]|nr:TetR/AcrR family transcriptional regulator C-terminal domain-containing protein [Pseudomonas aeruginosa]
MLNEPLLWLRVIGIGDAPSKERREKVVAEGVSMFLSRYGKRQILPDS